VSVDNKGKRVPLRRQLSSARALFFVGGFGTASWAPLVPILRERLAIAEDVLGMLLLCIGVGSLLTMPLSGAAAAKFGCRRTLTVSAAFFALLLLALCQVSSLGVAAALLFVFGAAMGCIDVVVNIQAVMVEKTARKRLMSNMHAMWSVGGFVGAAAFGVWVGWLGLTPAMSTLIAAAVIFALLAKFAEGLLPYGSERGGAIVAIPRGIVVFIGAVAFIAFLTEGAIMDWSGVFLRTIKGVDIASAGSGFAVFSAAMLVMRLVGDGAVNILGQKAVVIGGSLVAFLGFWLVVFAPVMALTYAGFFLIGIGGANVVPVFYSLMGKQKDLPLGSAVPAVSTLGYLGVLAGPAAIGFLAHQTSLYFAFVFLAVLTAVQAAIAAYVYRRVLS